MSTVPGDHRRGASSVYWPLTLLVVRNQQDAHAHTGHGRSGGHTHNCPLRLSNAQREFLSARPRKRHGALLPAAVGAGLPLVADQVPAGGLQGGARGR